MEQNKEQLKKLLEFLDEIVKDKDNYWFLEELRNRYGSKKSLNSIANDISFIRSALNIRGNNSLQYEYITDATLKNQLIVDNLRMENYALSFVSGDNTERLYNFCVCAFYQIENLINYYFYTKYPNLDDLLTNIEIHTKKSEHPFTRSSDKNVEDVGDIGMDKKIYAFCDCYYPFSAEKPDYTLRILSQLRQVRNEGLHRCNIIKDDPENKLHDFFKYQNFSKIRALLKKVSNTIETNLSNRQEEQVTNILENTENDEKDCINTNPDDNKIDDKELVESES